MWRHDEWAETSKRQPSIRDLAGIGHLTKSGQGWTGGRGDMLRQEGLCETD